MGYKILNDFLVYNSLTSSSYLYSEYVAKSLIFNVRTPVHIDTYQNSVQDFKAAEG